MHTNRLNDEDAPTGFMESLPSAKSPERQTLESDVRLWMDGLGPELRHTAERLLSGMRDRPEGISIEVWRERVDALRASADKAGFKDY